AALEGQVLDDVRGVVEVDLGGLEVDRGDLGDDRHLLGGGGAEREVDLRIHVHRDADLPGRLAEAGHDRLDLVDAREEAGEAVVAGAGGDSVAPAGKLGSGHVYGSAGKDAALGVLDHAGDRAGLAGPDTCRRQEQEPAENGRERTGSTRPSHGASLGLPILAKPRKTVKGVKIARGGVAERLKAPVLKTGGPQGPAGSNPVPSASPTLRRPSGVGRGVGRGSSASAGRAPGRRGTTGPRCRGRPPDGPRRGSAS